MKKFFLIILSTLLAFFVVNNHIQARSVADFTPALDKKVAKMKTTEEKVKWLQSLSDLLDSPRFRQDRNAKLFSDLREYTLNMLRVFEYELQEEQKEFSSKTISSSLKNANYTTKPSAIKLPNISDNFSNINEQKVRNTILSRHNKERNNVGINPYIYNLYLEGSATTRANNLANSHKTKNLHIRNNGDGYYNYNSILNWFSDLGIKFPKSSNGTTSFSESVGYGTYKCSKFDCTNELINAIKKTWTGLIMTEKASNGSHYRAATMKHFTQMGAGIAIDRPNNRYYLVIHYGTDF